VQSQHSTKPTLKIIGIVMKYALPKMVIGYCNKVTVTLLIYMKVDQAHNFLNAS